MSDCTSVTDFGVYELAKLGASLRYISVAKCTQVSDTGLQALARRCYKLRYVNVRGCVAIGDRGVDALARGCGRLRALDLGATDVADPGLQVNIVNFRTKIRYLSGCYDFDRWVGEDPTSIYI